MRKWKYMVSPLLSVNEMSDLGEHGWMLIVIHNNAMYWAKRVGK